MLTDSAVTTSPRPSSRSPRVAAATPGVAATSPTVRGGGRWRGDAPWDKQHYVHPSRLVVVKPRVGDVFSDMVHPECIRGLARDRNADGVYMDKDYTYNVGWMTNKCLRHADTLFVSHGGWAYVRDVAYTLWVQERKYG